TLSLFGASAQEYRNMTTSVADSVRVVSPGRTHVGKQGFTYGSGASAETVGARQVCMNVLPMPDGARAKVHYHKGIETIAYLLSGECIVYYGDDFGAPRHGARWRPSLRSAGHPSRSLQ
ncbi:MAG: hypothetical protein WA704_25750, partial [Pseudolabrys sp.]